MSETRARIRLVFSDGGTFHHEELNVPVSTVTGFDRLIDGLQEDPDLLKEVYLDLTRLCAAWVVPAED